MPQPVNGKAVECARVNAEDVFSVEKTRLILCTAVVVGRFVRITPQEETATLVLCDVQVFRVEGRAAMCVCTQSKYTKHRIGETRDNDN